MTPYLSQHAQLLGTIAKHWVKLDEESVTTLRGFASGLAPPRQGMVERNRARLRQFDLPANMDALVLLPSRVIQDVKKNDTGKREAALRVMFAVALEILSVAPMRVENLCGLEIDRHIVETRHGRARTRHIVIPGTETKTNVPFEKQLSPECCALLDTYISTYRTRVSATPGPWLFPGTNGGRRATTRLSTALQEFIFRQTGSVCIRTYSGTSPANSNFSTIPLALKRFGSFWAIRPAPPRCDSTLKPAPMRPCGVTKKRSPSYAKMLMRDWLRRRMTANQEDAP